MLWLWIEIPSFCSVLVLKEYPCPFCSRYVAGDWTKLKQHIFICGSPIKSRSTKTLGNPNHLAPNGIKLISISPSIDSACSSDHSDESNNKYCVYSSDEKCELKKCRKITQSTWEGVAFQKPNKLPHDIDSLCCFKLKDKNRFRLLEKIRDRCSWKKDSRMSWTGYETVGYRDCKGQIKSPNVQCNYFLQYKEPNCFHFAKDDSCNICGNASSRYPCNVRSYTAFKRDKAYIFHTGKYICAAKPKAKTVSNYAENVLKINPNSYSSRHLFKVQQSFRPLDNESLGMILWRLQKMLTAAALYRTKRKNKEKQYSTMDMVLMLLYLWNVLRMKKILYYFMKYPKMRSMYSSLLHLKYMLLIWCRKIQDIFFVKNTPTLMVKKVALKTLKP